MAKRFIDTELWGEDWFLEMPLDYKHFWIYLFCNCDHAGIWKPNFFTYCLINKSTVDPKMALKYFNVEKERMSVLENGKWWITGFIVFQYGKTLNENNNMHASVLNILKNNNIEIRPLVEVKERSGRGLGEVTAGVKDKVKDKDIIKDRIKEKQRIFYESLVEFIEKYDKETIREFFDYWSEPNQSRTKIRWELEKTWETARRLTTWSNRSKKGFKKKSIFEQNQQASNSVNPDDFTNY